MTRAGGVLREARVCGRRLLAHRSVRAALVVVPLLSAAVAAGVVLLAGMVSQGRPPMDAAELLGSVLVRASLAPAAAGAVVAWAATAEVRHGVLLRSFLLRPRAGGLVAARAAAAAGLAVVLALLAGTACVAVVLAWGPPTAIAPSAGTVAVALALHCCAVVAWTLACLGAALLGRGSVWPVALALLWPLAVENVLGTAARLSGLPPLAEAAGLLPGRAAWALQVPMSAAPGATHLLSGEGLAAAPVGALVLAGLAAGALLAGRRVVEVRGPARAA